MGDTNSICNISDFILEYDVIFDDPYATSIDEMYIGAMPIPINQGSINSF